MNLRVFYLTRWGLSDGYIILCTPHIISILIPLSFPAIPPLAPYFPSETMFFGIKPEKFRRRFLPYS